jgi:hypothetical protein
MSPNPLARNVFAYPNKSSGKLPLGTEAYGGSTDVSLRVVARDRCDKIFLTPAEAALAVQGRRQQSKKGLGICSTLEQAATLGS